MGKVKALHTGSVEDRREAARLMGSATSERKADAVRRNGAMGGRPLSSLGEIPCTCGAGESLEHASTCRRGRTIRRRRQKGQPLA